MTSSGGFIKIPKSDEEALMTGAGHDSKKRRAEARKKRESEELMKKAAEESLKKRAKKAGSSSAK
ncbi:hypothetical protein DCS_02198 [Drechmeria coniospora]|uniref:Uncharacterized protein n=1 Tax=Drechmeria coniospora TaxID=98403 RepID=A0A151GVE3_DRECN|nr:hypothetical protein DCS_02198 [Drechmeria coniospora]KYK61058.1 hypothetical protein DCS_02198 [Drechmeria coniospora]